MRTLASLLLIILFASCEKYGDVPPKQQPFVDGRIVNTDCQAKYIVLANRYGHADHDTMYIGTGPHEMVYEFTHDTTMVQIRTTKPSQFKVTLSVGCIDAVGLGEATLRVYRVGG